MDTILLIFQAGGSLFSTLLMILIIVAIFYFLVILPQKRQQQQLNELIESLKIGDEIVTNGGVIGKVVEVRKSSFVIRSADSSNLEIGKPSVVGKRQEAENK
jgi:preprotein translocase subunit YajC